MRIKYPPTPTTDQVGDYHGTPVADPYRWLEEPDSPETRAWIEAQNEQTSDYLSCIPARDKIRRRLTEIWDYPKEWTPVNPGERYLQLRNTGLLSPPTRSNTPPHCRALKQGRRRF